MLDVALRGLDDDGDAAEDIVQKAALKVLVIARRKPTKVEEVRDPSAWLVRVTKNMVHDDRRTGNRRKRIFYENEEHVRENLFPALDEGGGVDPGRDEILQVAQGILTPRQLAVVRRVLDGMEDSEIALDLELTPVTVRRHRGEAIRRLRKEFAPPANSGGGWGLVAWLAVFSGLCGCVDRGADPDTGAGLTPVEDWTTEPEFEFGDRFEGDALFGSVGDVDVRDGPEGPRIHVLDLQSSEVTIWTPDGTLIRRVGGEGEGPGEFTGPHDLVLLEDRFYVADERRFTSFTLEGEVTGTDAVPASLSWRGFRFRNEAMFDDGSFVVTPVVPSRIIVGSTGDDPVDVIPGLRISRKGASWTLDTLALISYRNWLVPFKLAGDPEPVRLSQEWVVPDSFRPDAPGGSVVLGRTQELPPGTLELMEISMTGDTVWTRQIRLPPVPIEGHEVEAVVNRKASVFASWSGDSVPSPILRQRVRGALIVPEAWPVTYGIRPMPNGEIWFRPSRSPTPGVWYAVRRGDGEGPIRRITLPESFNPRDVTDTHVWGTRTDGLGVQYVVGRRWVPADQPLVAYSSRTARDVGKTRATAVLAG